MRLKKFSYYPTSFDTQDGIINLLRSIFNAIMYPSYVDRTVNSARTQITSGTVTTVTTVATVTTITNPIAGITALGSYSSDVLVRNTNQNAWANTVRALIT
jgi:cAMP phosphodiesterase